MLKHEPIVNFTSSRPLVIDKQSSHNLMTDLSSPIFITWVHTRIINFVGLQNTNLVTVDLKYFIQVFQLNMMQNLASLELCSLSSLS